MKTEVRRLCVLGGACVALLSASAPAQAVRNPLEYPKKFKVRCAAVGNAADLAQRAFSASIAERSTHAERVDALAKFDTMLTSLYGLRRPLSSVKQGQGREDLERAAFLALNGYVISAQMAQGAMVRARAVPPEVAEVSGTMIYRLIEPYPGAATLEKFWGRSQDLDRQLIDVRPERRTYAAWMLRGVIYADPIAIESGRAGFCASGPSAQEVAAIERMANSQDRPAQGGR